MKTLIVRFWTDEGFVLRIGAMALAAGALYVAQPAGKSRTWYERAMISLAGAVSTGAVTVLGSNTTARPTTNGVIQVKVEGQPKPPAP